MNDKQEKAREYTDHEVFVREGPGKRFIEPRILFLINQEPSHGYQIMNRMRTVPMPGPLPDTGAVYRKLRSLEEEGSLDSKWEVAGPGPQRRVYSITPSGKKKLLNWARAIEKRTEILEKFVDLCDRELRTDS